MLWYRYRFKLEKGEEKFFEVGLDPKTLALQNPLPNPLPQWTRLEFEQCPNCPLKPEQIPFCPAAASISGLVEAFGDVLSIERADVIVESEQRTFFKRVSAQEGLFSLLGIYMASGGCPVTEKLRPMVRYHLPFAAADETVYRVVTTYLTAQYYRMRRGLPADWELTDLVRFYDDMKKVNIGFAGRLRRVLKQESLTNAVTILDVFASLFQAFSKKSVDSLEYLFAPYLK